MQIKIQNISFYDIGTGINLSAVDAYVDGTWAFSGPSASKNGYTGSISSVIVDGYDGYKLTLNKNTSYSSGQEVTAQIYVEDNEGN